MDGFAIFLRKELREAWRTARLPVVVGIFFLFGAISPLTAKYTPELLKMLGGNVTVILPPPQASDAVDQFLKNVGSNGVFVAILLAMGVVAREKERGTAAFMLTKPLSRTAFLAAKMAALALTLAAGVAVAGAVAYGYTVSLFGPVSLAGFAAAAALTLLWLLTFAAVTFLGSTLTRSSLAAAGIGLAALIMLALLGALPHIGLYAPGALLGAARAVALGQQAAHLAEALVGTLAVIAASLLCSWLAFRSQELAATPA